MVQAKGFRRVYYHYAKWEEYQQGMWRIVTEPDKRNYYLIKAAELMKNPADFKAAMLKAVEGWPISCERNFTAPAINHQAFIGHAGCCIATGSPEEITRAAWHTLNQEEQDRANQAADEVIAEWSRRYSAANGGGNA